MARPLKEGLKYFLLDINLDTKRKLIFAKYGLIGEAILIRLWALIYSESYFIEWTSEKELLFAHDVKCEQKLISNVINDSIKWGIFEENLYRNYNILTSYALQRYYFMVKKKCKTIKCIQEYLLFDVFACINPRTTLIYVDRNQPSNIISVHKDTRVYQDKDLDSSTLKSKRKKKNKTLKKEAAEPLEKDRFIYHLILETFKSKNEDDFNYGREGLHIRELEQKAYVRDGPEQFIKAVIVLFWQLIHSDSKFWKGQPFLPSVLNSGGIWPRVMKELENRQAEFDPEVEKIMESVF